MLSYLHEFHAGNHADILKHVTLLYTLEYLNKKDKPYSFFDTHAGSGLYDLKNEKALKTKEAARGIEKLLSEAENNPNKIPQELNSYLNLVKNSLKSGNYPGSPAIEALTKREDSPLFLTELHKTEFENLTENINTLNKKNIFIENKSGWDFIKSATPPQIKRGALLCDPSYEEISDYENSAKILCEVHKKWAAGTIILWYPLLAWRSDEIENMIYRIFASAKNANKNTEVLRAELLIDTKDSHQEKELAQSIGSEKPRLYGSGMLIVNPCWGLKEHLEKVLPFAANILGNNKNGSFSVELMEN